MNDSPSVRQIERGSYAPHYRKSSAWIFLSSDDSKSSASSFPSGGGPEASVDLCLSLLTSGEAARDDAGAGDEIPQGFLIRIGNHEAFRRTFCPTNLDHCVLCNLRINQFGHYFTLSPSMATKYGMYSVSASVIPNGCRQSKGSCLMFSFLLPRGQARRQIPIGN